VEQKSLCKTKKTKEKVEQKSGYKTCKIKRKDGEKIHRFFAPLFSKKWIKWIF
jgi:hypothetical protein